MPNGLSDGAVIIDTGINNSEFFRDAKAFKAAVQGLKQTVTRVGAEMGKSGGAYLRSLKTNMKANREFRDQMAALEKQAETLRNAIDKPGTGSKAYKAVEAEIKQVEAAMDEALKKRDSFINARGGVTDAAGYSAAAKQVQQYVDRLAELNAQRDRLANPTGDDIAQYQQRVNAYNQVAAKLAEMRQVANAAGGGFAVLMRNAGTAAAAIARLAGNGALAFLRKLASGAKNAAIQLAKLAGRAVVNGLKKVGQLAAGAAKSVLRLGRGARQSGNGFQFSLKNMLKYGLGIRSLFVLFNRLRSAIKEGFGELANYDPRVKAALASLKGALGGLKGSLSAAFAPILTAVAPALTTLINLLTQAVNAIGMFFAAITGQGYYTAAKGVAAVGSAAKGSSGSVKELKRQLAGFDELNILTANDGGGGGGGGGGGSDVNYTFDKVPIAEGIQNFVDQIKGLFAKGEYEQIGRVIADGINTAIQKAQDFIKWDNLGPAITKGVNALTGAINGLFDGVNWANLGATFGEGLNTITNTLLLWYRGIDWLSIGTAIGEALNGLIERVNWPNLGKLVSEKAHSLILTLKGAITTIQWGDAATKFASAVNAFFKNKNLFKDAGDTIDAALKGLLDFTGRFIIEFDEVEAAKSIREALGRIKWGDIATNFWNGAKLAFKKAGNFLKVLLGGDVYDVQGDAVEQMWERGSGNASSMSYAQSWAANLGKAVGNALGSIPWKTILDGAKKIFLDAFDGLLNGLFNSENGDIAIKIAAAIAGLKIAPTLIKGAIIKSLTGGGSPSGSSSNPVVGAPSFGKRTLDNVGETLQTLDGSFSEALFVAQELFNHRIKEEDIEEIGRTAEEIKESLGPLDKGPNGDYTIGLKKVTPRTGYAQAFVKENGLEEGWDKQDARLEKLGKTIDKNTKAVENQTDGSGYVYDPTKDPFSSQYSGPKNAKVDWDFGGEQTVNVGVNYTPKGQGGTSYTNNPLGWLTKIFAPGTDTKTRVELIRQGFTTITQWLGIYSGGDVNKPVGLLRNAFSTVAGWLTGGYMGGDVKKPVNLSNTPFGSVAAWLTGGYMGGNVKKPVNLSNTPFGSVAAWLTGGQMGGTVKKPVNLSNTPFGSVAAWLTGGQMGGTVKKPVNLSNTPFRSVAAWLTGGQMGGTVKKPVNLSNTPFRSVAAWLTGGFMGGNVSKGIGLDTDGGWSSVAGWLLSFMMGRNVSKGIGLATDGGWKSVAWWVLTYMMGGGVAKGIGLDTTGWRTVQWWMLTYMMGGNVNQKVGLEKYNWEWVDTWAQAFAQTPIKQEVELVKKPGNKLEYKTSTGSIVMEVAKSGGIATTHGLRKFAAGGMIRGGMAKWWSGIPKYASGTSRAHGTMFLAGEAGPEIVGHVNGRTEILNKSQLAQTMQSAVASGMITALRGITFTMPAMATGGVIPYEVSAQIARSTAEIENTLNANNEDLIQTIISVAGQIVAALNRQNSPQPVGAAALTAQNVIDEINRRTQMFGASPLKGV